MPSILRNILFPEEMNDRLVNESKRSGLSVSELIRRAIDAWFAGQKGSTDGRPHG
jgi:predicted DNA-binding protein